VGRGRARGRFGASLIRYNLFCCTRGDCRALALRNNRIHNASEEYADDSAILSTYVEGAATVRNEIITAPYDAIDLGYGWGYERPRRRQSLPLWHARV
jgi:hypothetical protein